MSTATKTDIQHRCGYCDKIFQRETSLAVHVCEPKRRFREQHEVGVQLGFAAYLRFYEIAQGSSRLRTFEEFVHSAYYRAFVKFGRHCQAIHAVAVPRWIDWLIQHNKKVDHWCRDSVYTEFLHQHTRQENVADALARAVETAMTWEHTTGNPSKDYLRYGNHNTICYAITSGRITAWALYNSSSGIDFLSQANSEHLAMIWPWIDADFWSQKFRDYPADAAYAREILDKAGW